MSPNNIVENIAPMKPSQVFFGDSLMRGVRPKKKPATQREGEGGAGVDAQSN